MTRTLSRGANMPEFCGGVLWSSWVPMFWAIQIKPMAKQPFCMMSEALRVGSVKYSLPFYSPTEFHL